MTFRLATLLAAIAHSLSASASCLPELKVTDKHTQCTEDRDCIIFGDACRSCGKLIIVNRNALKNLENLDAALRKKANCHLSCEACSTRGIALRCLKGRCERT